MVGAVIYGSLDLACPHLRVDLSWEGFGYCLEAFASDLSTPAIACFLKVSHTNPQIFPKRESNCMYINYLRQDLVPLLGTTKPLENKGFFFRIRVLEPFKNISDLLC